MAQGIKITPYYKLTLSARPKKLRTRRLLSPCRDRMRNWQQLYVDGIRFCAWSGLLLFNHMVQVDQLQVLALTVKRTSDSQSVPRYFVHHDFRHVMVGYSTTKLYENEMLKTDDVRGGDMAWWDKQDLPLSASSHIPYPLWTSAKLMWLLKRCPMLKQVHNLGL